MAGEHEPPVPEFHDYLVFDGPAFIDTDITVPENCSFVMNMGDEASRRQMRVIRVNPGGADGAIYSHISSFRTDVRSMSYAYDSSSSLKTHNSPTGSRIAWFMTPKRGGYGSQSSTYTKGDAHPLGGISLGGYTGDTSTSYYPYNGTIKYLRVYGSDAQNETSASAIRITTPRSSRLSRAFTAAARGCGTSKAGSSTAIPPGQEPSQWRMMNETNRHDHDILQDHQRQAGVSQCKSIYDEQADAWISNPTAET